MKYAILAGAAAIMAVPFVAQAADMPVYKAQPVVAAYSWTGCYIGGNGAYATQTDRSHLTGTDTDAGGFGAELADGSTPRTFDTRSQGIMGGGQIGCNYQTGSWVWGVEADLDGANVGRSVTQINLPQPPFPARSAISTTVANDLNWMGSVRGRLGYTLTDRWMFYVTGGWAYGDTQLIVSSVCPTCAPARFAVAGLDRSHGGAIVGWGSEYAIDNRWSLQTETAYFDLGRSTTAPVVYTYGANTSSLVVSTKERGWMTRVGINYKFY